MQINEYNNIYWSKYLLIVWITFGAIISFMSDLAFSSNVKIVLKICAIIGFCYYGSVLLFIIQISSKLYIEVNNTYFLMNSLLLSKYRFGLSLKLKVKNIFIIHLNVK